MADRLEAELRWLAQRADSLWAELERLESLRVPLGSLEKRMATTQARITEVQREMAALLAKGGGRLLPMDRVAYDLLAAELARLQQELAAARTVVDAARKLEGQILTAKLQWMQARQAQDAAANALRAHLTSVKADDWVWDAELDLRTCGRCRTLHNTRYKEPKAAPTGPWKSERGSPPLHPNCRCLLRPLRVRLSAEEIPFPRPDAVPLCAQDLGSRLAKHREFRENIAALQASIEQLGGAEFALETQREALANVRAEIARVEGVLARLESGPPPTASGPGVGLPLPSTPGFLRPEELAAREVARLRSELQALRQREALLEREVATHDARRREHERLTAALDQTYSALWRFLEDAAAEVGKCRDSVTSVWNIATGHVDRISEDLRWFRAQQATGYAVSYQMALQGLERLAVERQAVELLCGREGTLGGADEKWCKQERRRIWNETVMLTDVRDHAKRVMDRDARKAAEMGEAIRAWVDVAKAAEAQMANLERLWKETAAPVPGLPPRPKRTAAGLPPVDT